MRQSSAPSALVDCSLPKGTSQVRKELAISKLLTGRASGVRLDGLALLDEGVLAALAGGAGEAALDSRADGRVAQLGGEARCQAEHLVLGEHLEGSGEVPCLWWTVNCSREGFDDD